MTIENQNNIDKSSVDSKANNLINSYNEKTENTVIYQGRYSDVLKGIISKEDLNKDQLNQIYGILELLESSENITVTEGYITQLEQILKNKSAETVEVSAQTKQSILEDLPDLSGGNGVLSDIPVVGGVLDGAKEAWDTGVDAKNDYFLGKNKELLQEIEQIALIGKIPSDFEEDINLFFKDKFPGIDDPDKVKNSEDLRLALEMKEAIISSYNGKSKMLEDLDKQIDKMFDPTSNIVKFTDENGIIHEIPFNSPEEAGRFVYDFQVYAEQEIKSTFSISLFNITDYFNPANNFSNIIERGFKKFDFWETVYDLIVGSFETWFLVSLLAFSLTGTWENVARAFKDMTGNFGFDNYEEYARSEGSIEMSEEQKEMVNRNEIINDTKSMIAGLGEPERSKALKELDVIDLKYRRIKSPTFYLKIYWLNLYYLGDNPGKNKILRKIKYFSVSFYQGAKYLYFFKPLQGALNFGSKALGREKRFTFADVKVKNHEKYAYQIYRKSRMLEVKNLFNNFFELEDDSKNFRGFKIKTIKDNNVNSYIEDVLKSYNITDKKQEDKITLEIKKYIEDLKNFGGLSTEAAIKRKTFEIVHGIKNDLFRTQSDYEKVLRDVLDNNSDFKNIYDKIDNFGNRKKRLALSSLRNSIVGGYYFGNMESLRENIEKIFEGEIKKFNPPRILESDYRQIISSSVSESIGQGESTIKGKESFKKYLIDNGEKVNNYINYFVEQSKEQAKRDEFNDLKNKNFHSEEDYYKKLADILDLHVSGDIEHIKKTITDELKKYENTGNSDFSKEISKKDFNGLKEYLGLNQEMIDKINIELSNKGELYNFEKINKELEKFSDSLFGNGQILVHGYTKGQANTIISKIFSGEGFDDIIKDIHLEQNVVNFNKPQIILDIEENDRQIKKQEENLKKQEEIRTKNQEKIDKVNNLIDRAEFTLNHLYKDETSNDYLSKKTELDNIKADIENKINSQDYNFIQENDLKSKLDIQQIYTQNAIDRILSNLNQQQPPNNNPNNQNQSPNNSKENLEKKSKEVGKILDRLETQLLLEGNLSEVNKRKILDIQNQYLDRNKLEGLDINSFNGYLEREFFIGLKTAKELKALIKTKDILDKNDNKINFDIDFKISDFIKGVREGKFKLK